MKALDLYQFIANANRPQNIFDIVNKFGQSGLLLLEQLVLTNQVRTVAGYDYTYVAN